MLFFAFPLLVILNALLVLSDSEITTSSDGLLSSIQGALVSINEFPYYASLGNCGAAIISKRWVVTAAQCIPTDTETIPIWVGGEDEHSANPVYVDKVVVHPQYTVIKGLARLNDIALLRLSQPLEFNKKIQPVKLPLGDFFSCCHTIVGKTAVSSQWYGKYQWVVMNDNFVRLTEVQCSETLSQRKRKQLHSYWAEMNNAHICTKSQSYYQYYFTSGSPLVATDNTLVGITSRMPATYNEKVTFHVKMAAYAQWIKCVVRDNKDI